MASAGRRGECVVIVFSCPPEMCKNRPSPPFGEGEGLAKCSYSSTQGKSKHCFPPYPFHPPPPHTQSHLLPPFSPHTSHIYLFPSLSTHTSLLTHKPLPFPLHTHFSPHTYTSSLPSLHTLLPSHIHLLPPLSPHTSDPHTYNLLPPLPTHLSPHTYTSSLPPPHTPLSSRSYLGGLRLLQATCKKFYQYCAEHG